MLINRVSARILSIVSFLLELKHKSLHNIFSFVSWGHSKCTFARNFQLLTPSPLALFLPVIFTCTTAQRKFVLVSYPLPPLKKKFRDVYEFSNEKSRSEKREKK